MLPRTRNRRRKGDPVEMYWIAETIVNGKKKSKKLPLFDNDDSPSSSNIEDPEKAFLPVQPNQHTLENIDIHPHPSTPIKVEPRKQKLQENWAQHHAKFIEAYGDGLLVQTKVCFFCQNQLIPEAIVHCPDCSFGSVQCSDCYSNRHKNTWDHHPEIWRSCMFVPATLDAKTLRRTDGHSCGTECPSRLTLVDAKGRQHEADVYFCSCEAKSVTLIRHRLWPASPCFPKIAFHFDFMEFIRSVRIECHASVHSLCGSLAIRKHIVNGNVEKQSDIYRPLLESLPEYVHFQRTIKTCIDILPHSTYNICPACPSSDSEVPLIVSADANFGLVRKASASTQNGDSRYQNYFFVPQKQVDKKINLEKDTDSKQTYQECNQFQAGNTIRGKKKSTKLDEKAVFGISCKHEIPLIFCNIRGSGEKLGYVTHLMELLIQRCGRKETILLYDIGCILSAHVKMKFGPKFTKRLGLTDGECMERLWSYLRKFSNMTKEMAINNREDLLSEALENYTCKILQKIAINLTRQYDKAVTAEGTARDMLKTTYTGSLNEDELRNAWEKARIDEENSTNQNTKPDKYILNLKKYYDLSENIKSKSDESAISELKQIDNLLKSFERKHKQSRPSSTSNTYTRQLATEIDRQREKIHKSVADLESQRKFLLSLIAKYASGQAIYIRIQRSLKRCVKKIEKLRDQYKSLQPYPTLSEEACSLEEYNMSSPTLSSIQEAYHLLLRIDRAKEEQEFSKCEMNYYINYLEKRYKLIEQAIANTNDGATLSRLISQAIELEQTAANAMSQFKLHVKECIIHTQFIDKVNYLIIKENKILNNEIPSDAEQCDDNELHEYHEYSSSCESSSDDDTDLL